MNTTLKNSIFIGVLYILAYIFVCTLFKYYFAYWYTHSYWYTFLISVALSGTLFYKMMPSSSFYSTFRHELCHWLMGIVFFNKPYAFKVSGTGGGYYQSYGKGNVFINLAPYFLPITTLFLLLIQLFFAKPVRLYYILMGIAFAFDLISSYKDYHPRQTDWQISGGTVISVQFFILAAIVFIISSLTILFNGFDGYGIFLVKVWRLFLTLF